MTTNDHMGICSDIGKNQRVWAVTGNYLRRFQHSYARHSNLLYRVSRTTMPIATAPLNQMLESSLFRR